MAKLTLSLGSNLGNRRAILEAAIRELIARLGPLHYRSELIETPAWGLTDQPNFLNAVIVLAAPPDRPTYGSTLPPTLHRYLDACQAVEDQFGRVRGMPWGPRTLDVDLVFVDDIIYEDERLSLPHPWWRERTFVRDLLPIDLP